MAIDHERLMSAIDDARENAYGSEEVSALGARRARAIEYYLGMNTNPSPEGRSQVVDRSVYETISTMLPQIVRIFATSSDKVCTFTAVGPDDEQAADQTTSVVNHVVTAQNQWEQIVADWCHDCMLLGNGYAFAYWDDSEQQTREVYEGQGDDQLAMLLQDKSIRVIQHSQKVDEQATAEAQQAYEQQMLQFQQILPQWQQAAAQAQQQGQQPPPPPQQPQPPQPIMLHDVVIERVETVGKVCIKVLPPEHCYISADTPDWTLKDCNYFEFRQQKTIADLNAMGLDVPEDISDEGENTDEDDARDRFGEYDLDSDEKGVMRRVWSRMCWIKCDAENDGISRMYYVIAVGRTVLYAEPVGRIPVSSMTAQPLPHRHVGMSVAETVMDIQDIKTAVKRGGLDNLMLANAGRHIISSRVNLDDFLDARPGGVVRMLDDSLPSEGHVMPLTHPVIFDTVIGSLEYFDNERQNRSGAMRGAAGLEANALNKAAVGTTVAMQNAAAMRVEHIARMMAPAVEYLFSVVQELIAKHQNKALTIKLQGGEWVSVDPQAWRNKRDCRISVGVGAGNQESMMAQLANIFGAQMQLAPMGMAGPEQFHATVVEMAKLAGFANPTKFWADPQKIQQAPKQPSPEEVKAQTTMQIKQMELQADAQKFQAESQLRMQEIERQQAAKLAEVQANLELQAANDARDGERERQKMIMDAELERQRIESERYKADLDAQTRIQVAHISAQSSQVIAANRPMPQPRK